MTHAREPLWKDPLLLGGGAFSVLALVLLPFDRELLLLVNETACGPLEPLARFLDRMLPRTLLTIGALLGGGLWLFGRAASLRRHGLALLLMPLVANRITGVVKALTDRPRPQLADWSGENLHVLVKLADHKSFPSGHVTTAAAFAIALAWLLPPRRWMHWTVLALIPLMMWGRVVCTVHYPSDAAGGVAVACLTAFAWRRLAGGRDPALRSFWRVGAAAVILAFVAFIWRHALA